MSSLRFSKISKSTKAKLITHEKKIQDLGNLYYIQLLEDFMELLFDRQQLKAIY